MQKTGWTQLLILTLLLLPVQKTHSQWQVPPTKTFSPSRVYYSVFVRSFCDSNGDGIGDLRGLTSKLDYLRDLGIQGLWLLPVHPSPTYHKYDVTDYYGIDPDYGTLADYRKLVSEAHKRNMTVLLDLVVNHTSDRNKWFLDAATNPQGKYRNWYIWSDNPEDFKKEPYHWHALQDPKGHDLPGPRYYGYFWRTMPDLNFDNPEVRGEIYRIVRFWLEDAGIDGFRLDAAKYVYPNDQQEKNIQWWSEFRKEVEKIRKDAFIVGEVWGSSKEIAPYLREAMTACFDFQLADSIRASVRDEKDHYTLQTWWQIKDSYEKENPDFQDALILSNHDMNRVMTDIGNSLPRAKTAATLLLTLPGNPVVYYGEEIGMLGEKPDEFIREPFLWDVDGADPGQTHWEIPYCSKPANVKPLKYQKDDPNSLFNFYRNLIRLRDTLPSLQKGSFQPLVQGNRKIVAFFRESGGEKTLVMINLSKDIQRLESPADLRQYKIMARTHEVFKSGGNVVYLQPHAVFILTREQ
jgi:alpha-amylase